MNERLPQKWGKKRHWRMSLAFNWYYPSIEAKLSKLGYRHKKSTIFTLSHFFSQILFFLKKKSNKFGKKIPWFFENISRKTFGLWLSHWVIVFLKNQTCHENKLDHTFSQSKERLKRTGFRAELREQIREAL